ncbi:hypothetical protein EYC80_005796 [Monilinia laxa]|uniref:Uncharacterized protein n=1 Tax=Monilinia laxa TaxID=61186 RepID=A0A5N6KF17_MONLA|nr:hypothetical protein EYC80_005796 [Monilinia laxa]
MLDCVNDELNGSVIRIKFVHSFRMSDMIMYLTIVYTRNDSPRSRFISVIFSQSIPRLTWPNSPEIVPDINSYISPPI